jgi:predicted DNA-binding protein
MPDRGFRTITVTEALYEQVKQRAKREKKSAATYVSEILEVMLYIEDRFSNYAPFLELISLGEDEVVIRDNKKDRIVGVKAKSADAGKVRFYCELDATDYCQHTAFAAALPQVRNALRR